MGIARTYGRGGDPDWTLLALVIAAAGLLSVVVGAAVYFFAYTDLRGSPRVVTTYQGGVSLEYSASRRVQLPWSQVSAVVCRPGPAIVFKRGAAARYHVSGDVFPEGAWVEFEELVKRQLGNRVTY